MRCVAIISAATFVANAAQACVYSSTCTAAKTLLLDGTPVFQMAVDPPKHQTKSAPLTHAQMDALRLSVAQCWNPARLDKDAMAVSVTVGMTMNPNRTPDAGSVNLISFEGGSDTAAQQAFQAARRAIIRCGARGFALPPASYDAWRTVEMTFNSARMRIK